METVERPTLHHIAVAVENLDEASNIYESLGLPVGPKEIVAEERVNVAFTSLGTKAHLELLEPLGDGPVAKFLANRGPGIHHLCFQVKDVANTTQELMAKGFRLVYGAPRPGARGSLVNFIHPSSTGGVLIEIAEYPKT